MIVLNLQCSGGHGFEGWFASSEGFVAQCERGLVACPRCGGKEIVRLPSGPHVRRGSGDAAMERRATSADSSLAVQSPAADELPAMMFKALAAMARKAENVGERFPEEARRIHYEEVPARSIRGVASGDETRALIEEGIMVLPAPVPPESETH